MNHRLMIVAGFVLVCAACATQTPKDQTSAAPKPSMRVMGQSITPEKATSDEAIGLEIRRRLESASATGMAGVIVEVDSGIVTLRGVAPDMPTARRAVAAARSVKGVKEVYNRILVGGQVR